MLEQNYHPTITAPTRMVDTSKPSLVDNIFTHNITDPIAGNILEKISYDHLPNFLSLKLHNPRKGNQHIETRDLTSFDESKFKEDLDTLDLTHYQHLNANQLTQIFHQHFMKTYNTHAPIKVLSKKASKTKLKPWLTQGILKSIRIKRKYLSQYNTSKNTQYLAKFKLYRRSMYKRTNQHTSRKTYYNFFY